VVRDICVQRGVSILLRVSVPLWFLISEKKNTTASQRHGEELPQSGSLKAELRTCAIILALSENGRPTKYLARFFTVR
jgi:hypothetical protein